MTRVVSASVMFLLLATPSIVFGEEGRDTPTKVSDDLSERLRSRNAEKVIAATREVQAIGNRAAAEALMDLLRSGPPDAVTAAAIEGLGAIANDVSIDLLGEYARHRRADVRILALQSLSPIRSPRVEEIFTDALRDSDETVRSTAAQALGDGGYTESVTVLFQAFERGVSEACAAIGKLGDAEDAERLTTYLGRGDLPTLLEGLAEFFARSNFPMEAKQRIVEQLLELAGPDVRRFLVSQLTETPNNAGNRRLRQAMEEAIAQIPEE